MKTLADHWADWERKILDPIGAGATQRTETRRAFYGGARSLLASAMEMLDDSTSPDVVTEQELVNMDTLADEIHAFFDAVKAGRA